jgi:peptidoglycan hydrolase-like protein with peptidoglycan-binding domain
MLGVLVLACAASVTLGMRIANPRQLAAQAAPPRLTPLTYPVKRQTISQTVTFTATSGGGATTVPAVGGPDTQVLVVTGLPVRVGQRVSSGHVLAVVSGRPVIALTGHLPAYRDLRPGMTGPDVRQLRAALTTLGHSTSTDASNLFGPATQTAVAALYSRLGFQPQLTSENALRDRAKAQTALREAQTAFTSARATGTPAEVTAARTARDEARATLTDLIDTTGVVLPRGEVFALTERSSRVASVNVSVGKQVSAGDTLLTLSNGAPTLVGVVDTTVAVGIHPGLHGTARDPGTGESWAVTSVALPASAASGDGSTSGQSSGKDAAAKGSDQGTGTAGAGGQGTAGNVAVTFDTRVGKTPGSDTLQQGRQLEVTLTLIQTPHEVFCVPVTAVVMTGDGRTWLDIVPPAGESRRIPVQVGLSGGGFVEVSGSNALAEGLPIVVGRAASEGSS